MLLYVYLYATFISMKRIASKLLHYLAVNPADLQFVDRFIYNPLMHICTWIIYDDLPTFSIYNIRRWFKRHKAIFIGFILACCLYVAGFITHVNLSQELTWSYRSARYELYQQYQLNAELQQQLQTIINKRDYIRYRIFTESNILIPDGVPTSHLQLIMEQSKEHDIPLSILCRLIQKESRFDHSLVSPKGAEGYMQIMPLTFTEYGKQIGITNKSPENNIKVGCYILGNLFEYWNKRYSSDKSWQLALASYNAGAGAVKDYNNQIPPFKETQQYVAFILSTP